MARPIWFVNLLENYFPNRFSLARLTTVPVVGRIIDYGLFEGDDIIYLPKDSVIQINESVTHPEDMVLPSQLLEHFIHKANHHWIMNFCICRDASSCRDHPIDLGCLFLGEAALGINPELGRLVSKEEALAHVRRCRDAGLVHMIGRNKLDKIWLGVDLGEKLLTICNCCPCRCLWKMIPDIGPSIGRKITKMPTVSVVVTARCVGCSLCAEEVCFVDAIRMDDKLAVVNDACRGCGRCVEICPADAIELSFDEDLFVKESIRRLGYFSPKSEDSSITWGIGPVLTVPTNTDDAFGSDKWAAGPGAVIVWMKDRWVIGGLINNIWDYAGPSSAPDVNIMTAQYFLNYNFPAGFYFSSAPIITADWEADSGDTWTLPIGGGFGKVFRFGRLPINMGLQGYWNAVHPDNGAEWQMRFQAQFLFPK